ncbi:helix-turn-helix domain-containing protein [Streptomyces sp. NPDC059917]|uniref:helix-turn-helix domain-containing protein n=1 Tax=Streptomyces sp. NPDC059917 TaxID=3347002 RepID=UPI0036484052
MPLRGSTEQRRHVVERSLAIALGTLMETVPGRATSANTSLRAVVDRAQTATGVPDAGGPEPERARQRLFEKVVSEVPASVEDLATLSRGTAWSSLPRRVRPVVLAAGRPVPRALPLNTLWGVHDHSPCGLIPDPTPETERALPAVLEGYGAAIGPLVPLTDAGAAARWTHSLLHLGQEAPGRRGAVRVEDHLTTLLLMQDDRLSGVLAQRWMTRMDGMPAQRRERVSSTLLAWLQEGGARQAARVLNVHPQTVRYRIRQAEGAFGAALYDARSRLELELALSYQSLVERSERPRVLGRTHTVRGAGATVLGGRALGI